MNSRLWVAASVTRVGDFPFAVSLAHLQLGSLTRDVTHVIKCTRLSSFFLESLHGTKLYPTCIYYTLWIHRKRAIKMWSDSQGPEATYVALMRVFNKRKNRRMVEELNKLLFAQ